MVCNVGVLSGAHWAAGAGADRCTQGRAATAGGARLGRPHGHLWLHGAPAAAALPTGALLFSSVLHQHAEFVRFWPFHAYLTLICEAHLLSLWC